MTGRRLTPGATILFIGDSITHAHRRPEEKHDCYYLGGGYANRVMGELGRLYPRLALRAINRGECGHNTRNLEARWQADCLAERPAVISILTGINDAHHEIRPPMSAEEFEQNYRRLLVRSREALPTTQLVLLEPFGFSVAACPPPPPPVSPISAEHLANVPSRQQAVRKLAKEFGAVLVPLREPFEAALRQAGASHWSLDGVHPSAAGHALIAHEWLAATSVAGFYGS